MYIDCRINKFATSLLASLTGGLNEESIFRCVFKQQRGLEKTQTYRMSFMNDPLYMDNSRSALVNSLRVGFKTGLAVDLAAKEQ